MTKIFTAMAKVFKKKQQGTTSGSDYYTSLPKETSNGKTYAIEPTGEKTLLDDEGDPVMDIELNPHLYPEYTAKFANNPNPDVKIKATAGIKDSEDQMAWNAKWNRQEENARNRKVFRKEVRFQEALGEVNPEQTAKEVIYPKIDEFEWANPIANKDLADKQSQERQIAALVNSGMTIEDATQQITTGEPVNKTLSPRGEDIPLVRTNKGLQEVIGSGQYIAPELGVDIDMLKNNQSNNGQQINNVNNNSVNGWDWLENYWDSIETKAPNNIQRESTADERAKMGGTTWQEEIMKPVFAFTKKIGKSPNEAKTMNEQIDLIKKRYIIGKNKTNR